MQVALSVMLNPPKPGDASYELFAQEKNAELASLRRRAKLVTDAFNSLDGVSCTFTEGAMYAFPKLTLPAKVSATTLPHCAFPVFMTATHMLIPSSSTGAQCRR